VIHSLGAAAQSMKQEVLGRYQARIIHRHDRQAPQSPPASDSRLSSLFDSGFVHLTSLGVPVDYLAGKASKLFATVPQCDPALNTIAIRHPALLDEAPQLLLSHTLVNRLVRDYLGPDAIFDKMTLFRIPACSEREDVSGLWHHDRVGRRLKLFVFLHDVDGNTRPTFYLAGSHQQEYPTNSYRSSRFTDERKGDYKIVRFTGRKADAFLFDTNGIHRARYEATTFPRDVLVLEWASRAKGLALARCGLPVGTRTDLFPMLLKPECTLMAADEIRVTSEHLHYGVREPEGYNYFALDALQAG
jgi:hypothetical protein